MSILMLDIFLMQLKKGLIMKEILNRTRKYPFSPNELFFIFNEEALLIYKDPGEAGLMASDTLSEFINLYGEYFDTEKASGSHES